MQNLWTKIASAAVDLPSDHQAKATIIAGLDSACRKATKLASPFSEEWYAHAVEAILLNDNEAKRFFFFRLSEEYYTAHSELGLACAAMDDSIIRKLP